MPLEERRLELHRKLVALLGSPNVYHQPPENLALRFPAIIYSRTDYDVAHADDIPYHVTRQWQVSVVSQEPSNAIVDALMKWPMTTFKASYVVDRMRHDVVNIYY